jgi:hypothetical protein
MDFELKLNEHVEHDGYMPNVYPPRKMFSTSPAPQGVETSEENRNGGMKLIKKLAEAIEQDGKLK